MKLNITRLIIRTRQWIVLALLAAVTACKGGVEADTLTKTDEYTWFQEVAGAIGVTFEQNPGHRERHYLPETLGGGVGMLDFDSDGHLDLYFVQAGGIDSKRDDRPPNQLFRNLGNGTFEDVTEKAGVGDRGYGMGCVCADYDRDGDVDIYVTNVGANVLYRNNGNGTFMVATSHRGRWAATVAAGGGAIRFLFEPRRARARGSGPGRPGRQRDGALAGRQDNHAWAV